MAVSDVRLFQAEGFPFGGGYGIGKDGAGFLKNRVQFLVAGAEMCEHELLDFCGLRQLGGLVCGKVAFFECERSVFVGERTFETGEVGVMEMWYEVLAVTCVTAIYVAPWMSWGQFFKGESVGFDGMVERKSRYPDLVVLKQYLVSGNDMVAHFKIDMTPADAEEAPLRP